MQLCNFKNNFCLFCLYNLTSFWVNYLNFHISNCHFHCYLHLYFHRDCRIFLFTSTVFHFFLTFSNNSLFTCLHLLKNYLVLSLCFIILSLFLSLHNFFQLNIQCSNYIGQLVFLHQFTQKIHLVFYDG